MLLNKQMGQQVENMEGQVWDRSYFKQENIVNLGHKEAAVTQEYIRTFRNRNYLCKKWKRSD